MILWEVLARLLSEAAEETGPRRRRTVNQPGRPSIRGPVREPGPAPLSERVLFRKECGANDKAEAGSPVILAQALPAGCEAPVLARGGAPCSDCIPVVAPLALPGSRLPLL